MGLPDDSTIRPLYVTSNGVENALVVTKQSKIPIQKLVHAEKH